MPSTRPPGRRLSKSAGSYTPRYSCGTGTNAVRRWDREQRLARQYYFYVHEIDRYASDVHVSDLNAAVDDLKAKFWKYVFEKTEIASRTTSKFVQKFHQFEQQTAFMAFSEKNIRDILYMFFNNKDVIMAECLVDTFHTATKYHKKNKIHVEGWVHNKAYRVNGKIIIPYGVEYEPKWNTWSAYGSQRFRNFASDLDKVLCHLVGRDIVNVVTINTTIENRVTAVRSGADYTQSMH